MTDYQRIVCFALAICAMVAIGLMVSDANAGYRNCYYINGKFVCCNQYGNTVNCY